MGHISSLSNTLVFHSQRTQPFEVISPTFKWQSIEAEHIENSVLEKNFAISASRKNPASSAFDFLRTRLLPVLKDNNWSKIGITSPTDGCGKTFVAANLSITFARGQNNKVILLDFNLRSPSVANMFETSKKPSMYKYLSGLQQPESFFLRVMPNLLVGLNTDAYSQSSELLQSANATDTLERMQTGLAPDVTVFDMPSMLSCDDALACLPHLDAVILVVKGGKTSKSEIARAEKLLKGQVPLLGVVLNQAKDKHAFNC